MKPKDLREYRKHTATAALLSAEIELLNTDPDRNREMIQALTEKHRQKQEQIRSVEQFIYSVQDPIIRPLLHEHYMRGKTWDAASTAVYSYPAADAARMAVSRWIRNHDSGKN